MKKRHGMDSIQAPIQILHGRHPLGMLYATEQKKNYIGGPGAPSPAVSGIRGRACISAKSRRILEKFHSMHPLRMLHALEQKRRTSCSGGPHLHPFPEFVEKLVSRPNLVEFFKNFTACMP